MAAKLRKGDKVVVIAGKDKGRKGEITKDAVQQTLSAGADTVASVTTILAGAVRDTLAALQSQTRRKLVLRQVPIREGGAITGYVELLAEELDRPPHVRAASGLSAWRDSIAVIQDDATRQTSLEAAGKFPELARTLEQAIDLIEPGLDVEAGGVEQEAARREPRRQGRHVRPHRCIVTALQQLDRMRQRRRRRRADAQ